MRILDRLGSGEGMPIEAIRAATEDRTAVTPTLLEAIERCTPKGEIEENGLFIAFHLLGQWREKSAYRPLARFLRRPEAYRILDDAVSETVHRVMASVFDGDPGPIYDIINDSEADEFLRRGMFGALVIPVLHGELDRSEVARFLQSSFTALQPQGPCAVWNGWQGAVSALGLTELTPLVREAFERDFVDQVYLDFEEFEANLKQACDGDPLEAQQGWEYELFGDTIEELADWACFQPREPKVARRFVPSPAVPTHNPFRNVGRNDPCPCGSGKKFKKCCLDKQRVEPPTTVAVDDPFAMDEWDDLEDAHGQMQDYDPLVEPDPDEWLAASEQERIDAVKYYHRDARSEAERSTLHAVIHAVVENQIAEGDELPVRRTMTRLMDQGLDRHEAIHAVGSVLAGHLNELMREAKTAPDPEGDVNVPYFAELERLTAKDWLNSG
ncbi:MAG: hypothetical protein JWR80_531 [Bradyrhizobium sp.]|nr:hypothetical protein [Bradyrhizobium sp.]